MVLRLRSTFGTVLLVAGLALVAVAGAGYATELIETGEVVVVGLVGVVLLGVGARVLYGGRSE